MGDLVCVGDSVHWGQGLLRPHKLHVIVANELRKRDPQLIEHFMAHSGAVIGAGAAITRQRVDGEVPVGSPTIIEQVRSFSADPGNVDLVLVNGGINDVDIRNILNPFFPTHLLTDLTREHCFDSMRILLEETVQMFPMPSTRIIVTSYYPILSELSNPLRVPQLLEFQGVFAPLDFATAPAVQNPVVQHCLRFWRESTASLIDAVNDVNARHLPARITFVDAGYTEANAIYADDPWLFGLKPGLEPEDEVIDARHSACNAAIPPFDFLAREQCYRASAGHPNVTGAQRYAAAILSVP